MVEQFTYTVRFAGDLRDLVRGPMIEALENTSELVITSGEFTDYDGCIAAVSRLLSSLSSALSQKNGRAYVIVSKKNPIFDDENVELESTDGWDRFTVLRLYVADSEILKQQSTLTYLASADVKVSESAIDLIRNYASQSKQ